MKRAAAVLRLFLMADVGLEGGFLGIGIVCLAVASSYLSPAGPWAVVGAGSVLVGILLAIPRRAT